MSYPGHSLGGSYPSAEVQSVYSTAPADRAILSLSDSKPPHVSRTFLSILVNLNSVVVWMVSTRPLISYSSSLFNNPSVTVSKAPNTIGIIVTFMFHDFFKFPSKVEVLILLFIFFQFYFVISRDSEIYILASSLFLSIFIRSGRLAEIRWSVFMLKSHWNLCIIIII